MPEMTKLWMRSLAPGITATKGLQNEQRFLERAAVFQSAIEGKIVAQTASGDHPVQNIVCIWADGGEVGPGDPDSRNGVHVTSDGSQGANSG